ncbi:helix-turn-helix transcriptional regulator [Methylocystis rosea]|uniref:helix-turn-helix transcriptional regulator n=1 Tax=Methylocystis rosea TaxID=173366 RepID=UPI0005902105|nr:AlpA family phage regulatory protein [Methylocystis rosea]
MEHPILITLDQCARLTSLSRTAINRLRDENRFPVAVSLGSRRIGFVRAEVIAWLEARIAARGAEREAA